MQNIRNRFKSGRRSLNQRLDRPLGRHSTVMLGGARRRPRPNYLAIAVRALNEVIKIHKRLRPFMDEQARAVEQNRYMAECRAAIRRVYGPGALENSPPRSCDSAEAQIDPSVVEKQEVALAKSRLLLAQLNSKLHNR